MVWWLLTHTTFIKCNKSPEEAALIFLKSLSRLLVLFEKVEPECFYQRLCMGLSCSALGVFPALLYMQESHLGVVHFPVQTERDKEDEQQRGGEKRRSHVLLATTGCI